MGTYYVLYAVGTEARWRLKDASETFTRQSSEAAMVTPENLVTINPERLKGGRRADRRH